jgi:hypothetical protein
LSQILESNVDAPVYILSGLEPQHEAVPNWLSQSIAWIGLIAIMAGSFLLQIQIMSVPAGWAQSTLLMLSVIAELGLLWVWNSLFA